MYQNVSVKEKNLDPLKSKIMRIALELTRKYENCKLKSTKRTL